MVATRPGSDRLSSGSERSRAAPAACSMVPMAPSQTRPPPPDRARAAGLVPADDGPLMSPPRLRSSAAFAVALCWLVRSQARSRPGVPLSASTALLRLRFGERVEDLERHLGDQPVSVIVEPQPGDLFDPLDPVGHRVRVDVQQPRGAL